MRLFEHDYILSFALHRYNFQCLALHLSLSLQMLDMSTPEQRLSNYCCVASARRRTRRWGAHGEERGGSISCRHAHSLFWLSFIKHHCFTGSSSLCIFFLVYSSLSHCAQLIIN